MGKRRLTKLRLHQFESRRVQRRLLVEHLGDRRVLAAITGVVFEDVDHSLRQEAGEISLPQRLVYLDANDNGTLDRGERFTLTDDSGKFSFDNLADGLHNVRLFNGSSIQRQLFPIRPTNESGTVAIESGKSVAYASDSAAWVLTNETIEIADLQSGLANSVAIGSNLVKFQSLPDGNLIVIGGGAEGDTAWLVDPTTHSAEPIDLSGSAQSVAWQDVAIDANGRGVLIQSDADATFLRAVDASDSENGVVVSTTNTTVPADATVLTSLTGNRSVLAWAGDDGLMLSLWSNETASLISPTPIEVSGVNELLDFDDSSGLLVLRESAGGVSVLDANADFASLHSFPDLTGPAIVDGSRDLLLTVSPLTEMLSLIDLRNGSLIADLAIDLSTIGEIASIANSGKPDSLAILGAAGVLELSLKREAAHRVQIIDGQDADAVLFALAVDDVENTPPRFESMPTLSVAEDTKLVAPAPAALVGAVDDAGDQFVLLQVGNASNGTAEIAVDGMVVYQPNDDFFGTDTVTVVLHDGVSVSDQIQITITVTPVPDPPIDVIITLNPVPESLAIGDPVGQVEVIDVDRIDNHIIQINDPRFVPQNGMIIFIGGPAGVGLDYETEPLIPLIITVTDPETETEIVKHSALTVTDVNEPITGILPTEASVFENAVGDIVTELLVLDEDTEQFHILTVDDPRFVIDGKDLRLADGVSLNYEETQVIIVNVTATEADTGDNFTQAITIRVLDLPEQPVAMGLTGFSVPELQPGAEVGTVTLDGLPANERYHLTVDNSRFEIVGGLLKLRENEHVELAVQSEFQLTITAADSQSVFTQLSKTFIIEVLRNETPFHNESNPFDVDFSGSVTAGDALIIINYLNSFGPGPVGHGNPMYGYDVNGDGFVTALDALLILNEVNRLSAVGSMVGGEEEKTAAEGEQLTENDQDEAPEQDSLQDNLPTAQRQWAAPLAPMLAVDQPSETTDTKEISGVTTPERDQAIVQSVQGSGVPDERSGDRERLYDQLASEQRESSSAADASDLSLQALISNRAWRFPDSRINRQTLP